LVYLTTSLETGGAETQLVNVAGELKTRGWDVSVISLREPMSYQEELAQSGVPVHYLSLSPGKPQLRAWTETASLLRKLRPSVLMAFMFHANVVARTAGRLAGVPVTVSSIRSVTFGGARRDALLRSTDWLGDITTTNSQLAAKELVRRRVVPANRLRVIPNGLVPSRYQQPDSVRWEMRRRLGLGESDFLFLAVGRVTEAKDYPSLLKAFSRFRDAHRVHLAIAGTGEGLPELRDVANRLRAADRVQFLGHCADVPQLLQAADAFVMSSAWEGLPNAMMEALAAGVPVVSTRVGGVAELVHPEVSGLLVPPGDPDALGIAMEQLVGVPYDRRRAMGAAGRLHIEANYGLPRVVDQWEALYEEFLAFKCGFAGRATVSQEA
jgi:glycosyltransferase involved in cell wall biosynthesis